jgi:hypothetical protein
MSTKCSHLDLHIWVERKGLQNLVKLGRSFDLEDADIRELPNDTPEMQPVALTLKLSRPFVLSGTQLIYLFRSDVMGNPDSYGDVEQHELFSRWSGMVQNVQSLPRGALLSLTSFSQASARETVTDAAAVEAFRKCAAGHSPSLADRDRALARHGMKQHEGIF